MPRDLAAETALLTLIAARTTQGPVPRDPLATEARGMGLDFGRLIRDLRDRGLIEEIVDQPGWFRRLLGAAPVRRIALTNDGRLLTAPAPEQPPAAETAARAVPADPQPQDGRTVADQDSDAPPAAQLAEPSQAQAPQSRPARRKAARAPAGYTEDLGGGIPPQARRPDIDPEALAGISETLGQLGLELTPNGEALVAARMDQGASAGAALCQVVLYAYAHAVRHEIDWGPTMPPETFREHVLEVIAELERLRDIGAIDSAPFEADMLRLWGIVEDSPLREARLAAILSDPLGGAAPPAFLTDAALRAAE